MDCIGKCYFCQTGKCILSKRVCTLCSTKIKKISDKLSIKDHLEYVINRNRFRMNMMLSLVSIGIALLVLYVRVNQITH